MGVGLGAKVLGARASRGFCVCSIGFDQVFYGHCRIMLQKLHGFV